MQEAVPVLPVLPEVLQLQVLQNALHVVQVLGLLLPQDHAPPVLLGSIKEMQELHPASTALPVLDLLLVPHLALRVMLVPSLNRPRLHVTHVLLGSSLLELEILRVLIVPQERFQTPQEVHHALHVLSVITQLLDQRPALCALQDHTAHQRLLHQLHAQRDNTLL